MTTKSKVEDGPAGGVVVQISKAAMLFLGFQEGLLNLAAGQDFANLVEYRNKSGTEAKTVRCSFSEGRFRRLKLPSSIKSEVRKVGGYREFNLDGRLHYSQEGLVFGVLPLRES